MLDNLTGGDRGNLDVLPHQDRLRFVDGDIRDAETVRSAMADCSLVFHQAAMGSVPRSVEMPVEYHEVNVTGTMNVLEAARQTGVCRVMFAASSSAYGDTPTLPKVESMPVLPRSPYAATKVGGEAYLRAYALSYAKQGGPDTVNLRYFNIFGPRQNANSAYAAVIAAFAKALLNGEQPVIFGNGEQSRDFTFVHNAVHANLLAARAKGRLEGEVINVACARQTTVNELAKTMAEQLGRPDLTPIHRDTRAGDVLHSLADLERAKTILGYDPIVDFEPGLASTSEWYRSVMVGR